MSNLSRVVLITTALLITGCHPQASKDQPTKESHELKQLPMDNTTAEAAPPPTTSQPSATLMSKVAGGYELKNDSMRVVISEQTGNIVYWSLPNSDRNVLYLKGVGTQLIGQTEIQLVGYVEKRDDQTWQFFGTDSSGITWRKIYCLEGPSLLMSVIVQNGQTKPISTAIQITGDFPNLRILQHTGDQFTGRSGYTQVNLQCFNEFHNQPTPTLPVLLQSDTRTLQPQERLAMTTEWKLMSGTN